MPRIAFTIPIMPGKQQECISLLQRYKRELDEAHAAVGATQWCKFIDRDEYVEFIDWQGDKPFVGLLREYLAHPAMQEFLGLITPHVMVPPAPEGRDETQFTAEFLQGRAMNQAYAQTPPPA
jgi:hypothetical protein